MNGVLISVRGDPAPKGSAHPYENNGKTYTTMRTPKNNKWKRDVQNEAWEVIRLINKRIYPDCWKLYNEPLEVIIEFRMPGDKPHGTPYDKTPDIDKVMRSTFDALEGIIYKNDCLIVGGSQRQIYGSPTGCSMIIRPFMPGNNTAALRGAV